VSKPISNKFQIPDAEPVKPYLVEVKRAPERVFSFGAYILDTRERTLTRGGISVSLTNKAFEILLLLVENRGRLVTKDLLMSMIWPDTFVEEKTLAQNIFTLRKTLGEDTNGASFIETVPKHGYRFRAEVTVCSTEPQPAEPGLTENEAAAPSLNTARALPGVSERSPAEDRRFAPRVLSFALPVSLVLLGIGLIVGVALYSRQNVLAKRVFQKILLTRLTNTGNVTAVALSPDGRFVAYAARQGSNESLYLRQIEPATLLEVVPPAPVNFRGMTFAPDTRWIYYVTAPPDKITGTLYRVSLLGGPPERVGSRTVDSRIAFSPDGTRFAFVRWADPRTNALYTARADGSEEKQLAVLKSGQTFGAAGPAWSPDGTLLLIATQRSDQGPHGAALLAVDAGTGLTRPLAPGEWNWIGQIAWLNDGSGFVFTAWNPESETMSDQIWLMSYPGGVRRRITADINGYLGVDVAASGNTIVASESMPDVGLWSVRPGDNSPALKLTSGNGELYTERLGLAAAADGAVVISSRQNAEPKLWRIPSNGGPPAQLTTASGRDYQPAISRDGKLIVFVSTRTGSDQLWRMAADGSDQILLTPMKGVRSPSLTEDGQWVVFEGNVPDEPTIWRVPASGGTAVQVFPHPAFLPVVSPDGKFVACLLPSGDQTQGKLTVISAADGKIQTQFDGTVPRGTPALRWSADGRAIAYVVTENGISNIWAQRVDGTPPNPLTSWTAETVMRFDWSSTGTLVCERGLALTDLILIRDQTGAE
jgi:DNA-binding winged helix-turn-helix (wHTH) protein/Tol biopolymer transport system component